MNETDQTAKIVYIFDVVEIREIVIMRIIRKSKSEKIEILRVDRSVFKNCLHSQNFLRCAFFQAIWDYQYFFFLSQQLYHNTQIISGKVLFGVCWEC